MTTQTTTRSKTYDMVYIAVFAVLIAICSWISIPMTVPFTLQTFAVFLAVGVLGGKRGSLAVLIYILLGAVGIRRVLRWYRCSAGQHRRLHYRIFILRTADVADREAVRT